MSDSNAVTTKVHDFVAGIKAKPPGTKMDYPPAAMAILDVHSEYFATNAMLSPVMFSTIGVLRKKLRNAGATEELESMGIDAYNLDKNDEQSATMGDDHTFEIGFDVAERPTIEVARFAYSLLKQQAIAGARMYGKEYPPYTLGQAIDWLIAAEPRDNSKQLSSAVSAQLDSELMAMGINLNELHANEAMAITRREENNKESLKEQRADLLALFREVGTIDLVQGWNALPLLLQYKCAVKVLDSLKRALARKSAMVKTNPKHPNASQMTNELGPLSELIKDITLDCHAVYRANRELFDEAFDSGNAPELPKLGN